DNVMVHRDGRVLVMDFGLARERGAVELEGGQALDADVLTSHSELSHDLTATGAVMGTPAYMAPEQFSGIEADARADQFAFCVTLWEALHDSRPFAGDNLYQIMQSVLDGRLSPAKGDVPGWIHQVLVRGLARDPEARWPDMQALLDALESDPTRRRRGLFAAGSAVLILVGAIAGSSAWRQHQHGQRVAACEAEAALVERDWQTHHDEVARAFAASSSTLAGSTWTHVEPVMAAYARKWSEVRGETCRAAAVEASLDAETRTQIDTCLDAQRESFLGVLEAWTRLDGFDVVAAPVAAASLPAPTMCTNEAAASHRRLPPPELTTQVADLRRRLEHVGGLSLAGQYEAALVEAHAVEAEAEALGWRPLEAEVALSLGALYWETGKLEDARAALEGGIYDALAASHDLAALEAVTRLIWLVGWNLVEFEQARRWAKLGDSLLLRLDLGDTLYEAKLHNSKGRLLQSQGHSEEALVEYRRGLEILLALLEPDSPSIGGALGNIGIALWQLGRYDESLEQQRRALAIRERAYGPDHPQVAITCNNMGLVLWDLGDYDEALALHRRALAIRERAYGPDNVDVGTSYNNMGLVLWAQGKLTEALAAFEHARVIWSAALGPDHADIASTLNNIGLIQNDLGQHQAALESQLAALAIRETQLGPDHADTGMSHNNIAVVLRSLGRREEALEAFERARSIQERALGDRHPDLAQTLVNIGALQIDMGRLDEGWATLQQGLAMYEATVGKEHRDLLFSLLRLSDAALLRRDPETARSYALRARTIVGSGRELGDRVDRAFAQLRLAKALWALDQPQQAREQARAGLEEIEGLESDATADIRPLLDEWLAKHP
ncbi:MAG: tetratricopeptide repeat protein, partial [Myxococcales bacterium]|nr:tetratricopeptide repeat protein [Myxococcales bacterium]